MFIQSTTIKNFNSHSKKISKYNSGRMVTQPAYYGTNVYDNATFFDFDEIANDTGVSHNILRGVLSSLIKKELINLDGSTWYGKTIIDGAVFSVTYKGLITYYYYFTEEFN